MHVLYIDPSSISHKIIRRMLQGNMDLTMVSNLDEGMLNLSKNDFDLVLLAYESGDDSVLDFIREIRSGDLSAADKGVVLITTTYTGSMAYKAMQAGANDIIVKPLDPETLLQTVNVQAMAPFINEVKRDHCSLTIMSWHLGHRYYEYSPDLNRLVSGFSDDEARAQMQVLIEDSIPDLAHSRFGEAFVRTRSVHVQFPDNI